MPKNTEKSLKKAETPDSSIRPIHLRALGRIRRKLQYAVARKPKARDETRVLEPFVARFKTLDQRIVEPRSGPLPPLRGRYEDWLEFMREAVAQDAKPSRELIAANYQLAAWEARLKVGKLQSFPISLSVAFTDTCNARCNFCAYVPERITGGKLALEDVEKLDWLKFTRQFRPNVQYGEPFGHPQVLEIFQTLRRLGPHLDLASITNGAYLLKPGVIDFIVSEFSLLYVSLNATSRAVYEKTMPPLKFDTLTAGLAALRDAKIERGVSAPRLDAGYVVYNGNLDDMLDLPEFLAEYGFSRVNVKPMQPPPRCSESDRLLTPDDSVFTQPEHADAVFRETELRAARLGIEMIRPLPSFEDLSQKYGRPDYLRLDALPMQ